MLIRVNCGNLITSDVNATWYSKFMEVINQFVPKSFVPKRGVFPCCQKHYLIHMKEKCPSVDMPNTPTVPPKEIERHYFEIGLPLS